MVKQLEECVWQLRSGCDAGPKEEVQLAIARMEEAMKSLDVIGKMKEIARPKNSRCSDVT